MSKKTLLGLASLMTTMGMIGGNVYSNKQEPQPFIFESREEYNTKANYQQFLSKKNNYPVYFHCNIGTNRTGTVAMLLQALCGVEEEELLKDYMFSNFGTICVAERQYDKKPEPRAETTDVTVTNEVFYRIVNASGSNISEKAISVLKQAGVSEETALKVKSLLLA